MERDRRSRAKVAEEAERERRATIVLLYLLEQPEPVLGGTLADDLAARCGSREAATTTRVWLSEPAQGLVCRVDGHASRSRYGLTEAGRVRAVELKAQRDAERSARKAAA